MTAFLLMSALDMDENRAVKIRLGALDASLVMLLKRLCGMLVIGYNLLIYFLVLNDILV